jgi:hypothetical protein
MVEVTHDSAEDDPERGWSRGKIFRCTACSEEIRVVPPNESAASDPLS